nr:MAG TPA: hypothetical protein [Caudoviricetes sp.]
MAVITEIKTNLTRISKAKTDIIAAITAKGGTVASGAKIEDLPACIRAIPTGGGGETAYLKIAYSTGPLTYIVLPGRYIEASEDMEEIECKVGDLVGIVAWSAGVSAELGCVLTYSLTAGSGLSKKYIFFFTVTETDAAINIK